MDKWKRCFTYSLTVFLFCSPVFALDERNAEGSSHVHGSHTECPLPKKIQDLVDCVRESSPSAQRAALELRLTKGLIDVAGRIPNPTLDVESGFGKENGSSKSSLQVALVQPIEWGGRRASRVQAAEAEIQKATASQLDSEMDLVKATILNLYRLRQIESEKSAIVGTIDALTKTVKQQQSRAALSPDQRGTLSLYKMALSDAKINLSEMNDEERSLEHFFHISTGHSLSEIANVIPEVRTKWPDVSEGVSTEAISPGIMKSIADLKLAQADLNAARAESWPALHIGPMFTFDREGETSNTLYGLKLSMDLPVFGLNASGRGYANEAVSKAKKFMSLLKADEAHERKEQLKVYKSAVESLMNAPSVQEIEREHGVNEKLARQGLVTGSLLVESYRQRNELIRSRNGREFKALEALFNIYKLDGRSLEENL